MPIRYIVIVSSFILDSSNLCLLFYFNLPSLLKDHFYQLSQRTSFDFTDFLLFCWVVSVSFLSPELEFFWNFLCTTELLAMLSSCGGSQRGEKYGKFIPSLLTPKSAVLPQLACLYLLFNLNIVSYTPFPDFVFVWFLFSVRESVKPAHFTPSRTRVCQ